MPLDPQSAGYSSIPVHVAWSDSDVMLYALSLGAGVDELERTTENTQGRPLLPYPWMPVLYCQPSADVWDSIGPFDWRGLVHARQDLAIHAPFPVSGHAHANTTVTALHDKGSAAIVETETVLVNDDGTRLATGHGLTYIRGAGGWGGDRGPSAASAPLPDREPDRIVTMRTRVDQPLLYRINGDRNPLHSDPEFARAAGFDRPIMHGLCSLGMSLRSVLEELPEEATIDAMGARFARPVLPGDDLVTTMWFEDAGAVRFEAASSGTVVLDAGIVRLRH